jgi:hypothetical protein
MDREPVKTSLRQSVHTSYALRQLGKLNMAF